MFRATPVAADRARSEAAGYELARFYTVIEKSFERVCLAFENHFEKRQDYHERLLQRMAIDLPGIRPAFVPAEELPVLRDFKGFRHVVPRVRSRAASGAARCPG